MTNESKVFKLTATYSAVVTNTTVAVTDTNTNKTIAEKFFDQELLQSTHYDLTNIDNVIDAISWIKSEDEVIQIILEYLSGQSIEHVLTLADSVADLIESRRIDAYQHIAYWYGYCGLVVTPFANDDKVKLYTEEEYNIAFPDNEKLYWAQ